MHVEFAVGKKGSIFFLKMNCGKFLLLLIL